jgi:hypothetical protein
MTKRNRPWTKSAGNVDRVTEKAIRDIKALLPKQETPVLLVWYGKLGRTFLVFTQTRMWYGTRLHRGTVTLSLVDARRHNPRVEFLKQIYPPSTVQDIQLNNNDTIVRKHFQRT